MSDHSTIPSDTPMDIRRRIGIIAGTFEPAVFEEALAFLRSLEPASRDPASKNEDEKKTLSLTARKKTVQALRLLLRFGRHWHDQPREEAARDLDRHEVYGKMPPEDRVRFARALTRSLAGPVRDLLVLEALDKELGDGPEPER